MAAGGEGCVPCEGACLPILARFPRSKSSPPRDQRTRLSLMQSSAGLRENHFISKYAKHKLLLRHSRSQKQRLQNAHCATVAPHADAPAVAAHRCDRLRRLEARHG